MAWRGLHISKPSRLFLNHNQMVVGQDGTELRFAIEDIAWIILDTPQVSLTSALMSACMDADIAVIMTDEKHLPCGMGLPFHRHFRQGNIAEIQTMAGVPLKKRLWQTIIQSKICNQATVLDLAGQEGSQPLREMAKLVKSGDPDNVEARAAREYWSCLWDNFRRKDDADHRNMLLNYGYAVVRASVARALVASGLLPAIGIHHACGVNAFNLADDLIEPFRPFVDFFTWQKNRNAVSQDINLSLEDRQEMAGILLTEVRIDNGNQTLLAATETSAASLVRAMESSAPQALFLPEFPQ